MQIAKLDLPDTFCPFAPVTHPACAHRREPRESDIFAAMRRGDFWCIIRFNHSRTACWGCWMPRERPARAGDQQTLYRTAKNSPIVTALLRACEKGKEVNVAVEIRRASTSHNIEWVRVWSAPGRTFHMVLSASRRMQNDADRT